MKHFERVTLKQNAERAERYHENLISTKGKVAREYLERRGLGGDVVVDYKLGLCDDIHPGRLAIPYLREPHGVIFFNYRALDGSTPKYKAPGERHLFNTAALNTADQTGEVAITEGELDAITATALCDLPAVGIPGATQWTGNPHWRELFVGYQRVWILADPDQAGLELASALLESIPSARLVSLPGDVNETYLKHGSLEQFIEQAR